MRFNVLSVGLSGGFRELDFKSAPELYHAGVNDEKQLTGLTITKNLEFDKRLLALNFKR